MNSYLKIYLKFALFILISFSLTSFIIAVIINFMHLSNFLYHLLINLLAAMIMIIWAFMIVKTFTKKTILHSIICGLVFSFIAIIFNLDQLNILNIISRPFVLIMSVIILTLYKKKLNEKV